MLSGFSKILVSLMILTGVGTSALAESTNLQFAKNDIEALYQQWRLSHPKVPISSKAFLAYLNQSQVSGQAASLGYNSFPERFEPITYHLPSGGWIIGTYIPAANHLLGFYVDLNGAKLPNGHLFGEDSDQFQLEMDENGHIGL